MSTLVKVNYAIGLCVCFLGLIAIIMMARPSVEPDSRAVVLESHQASVKIRQPEHVDNASILQGIEPATGRTGDWRYECKLSMEGMEACSALRRVLWEDGKSEALLAVLTAVERQGAKTPRLKLMAPLGTFLPGGISMQIDEQEPFIVPFQACAVEGCFVNLDLAPEVVDALRSGAVMVVEYMTPDQKVATVRIPLNGVEDAISKVAG